ncbi:nucleotidyltransferase family protein [Alistipes onderdonkii]|jgi:dTDP-glucose pyrophosphorylase|uniref:Mannose-1-phosphate guanylyltransferase n=1 Tax=Alistipes onderdonkii TaxID=328813 RepID=A0A1Y3QWV3_9BACT|nr:nucleotidyltransferase family protein [Alistipes onderdonkii]MBE5047616.1 nucleotidyltransferase family protein [Alistipes onderdonkii]MBV4194755.1 nucleotidyltransferase family protein [Alistipes onderdonkii]OUN02758.1 mannose-1-phosphate guanylyltransferase [Alistipes onderdonkii]
MEKIKNRIITPTTSLIESMKKMDSVGVKVLFVFRDDTFLGLLTIGDIQRAIIRNVDLGEAVESVLDHAKIYASVKDSKDDIKSKMAQLRAECMPILDEQGRLTDVIFWRDLFVKNQSPRSETIHLPVVIMAGGKGTRLQPLTNVFPKPLIPIGERTILEEIMDQFETIGCNEFYMSVNYKCDIMKFYLEQLEHKYSVTFFKEDQPLGTIGSVSLLKGKINTPFFVSNCDILIDQDYRDVYDYHCKNRNDITIVTAVKSFKIPYGVIETGENGLMTTLTEKPETTYMINTGVYILQPELIDEIPENEFYHITNLMEKIQARGGRIGCFPVSEKSWTDIGEWREYLKLIDRC